MAEFRDLSSGKGPGLPGPGSYPDSIVRISILVGGENENVAICFFHQVGHIKSYRGVSTTGG